MIEALILGRQSIDLGCENLLFVRQTLALGIEPSILCPCRQHHRLQRLRVVGQVVR